MKITPYILLTLATITMASISPTPYCKQRPLYSHLALTPNETIVGDLDYAFTGYNLDYSIAQGSQFATITPKLSFQDFKNYNFDDIISMKVTHNGNRWANQMFVLSDDLGLVKIHYGVFNQHEKSPELLAASVDYHQNTTCFDALLFTDQGYAIVDCIKETSDKVWQNRFIYVNLGKQQRDGQLINEFYGDFNHHTRRKLFRYHDAHNGIEYIIRAYMSHDNNSYIELLHASDIKNIEVLRVFDRSQLSLDKLNIVDIHVYLGDIFFLDYYTGLYRLDILRGQMIQVTGHYPCQHFSKFSLYSDDLDGQLLMALSNSHVIHEIKLDRISQPYLVCKYSIPSHSFVHQISIDSKFLIVQASANVSTGSEFIISNYTYIFTKGSRTYMNAYKVIQHKSTNVIFDYDRIERRLMFAAETNVTNYKLNDPSLILYQQNSGAIGTNATLTIVATSSDPHSDKVITCNSTTSVSFVNSTSKSIYPTDIPVPSTYYANYPGVVNINLRNYAFGPNITYNISDSSKLQYPPIFWLDQQNVSKVQFDQNPITPSNLHFFWAQVFPTRGNNTIYYFYQQGNNNFYVSRCDHYYNDIIINCHQVYQTNFRYRIKSFTSVPFIIEGIFHLYYAITLHESNTVFIHDNGHERIGVLQFPQGYQGHIGDIEASNGFLYIVFPQIKTIRVYRLQRCQDHHCPIEFEINSHTMSNLGVNYFKPIDLVTSRFHPQVLFINCLGSLIIVDIDNHEHLILLSQITNSPAVAVNGYQIAVHHQYLVIVAAPNIIQQYHMKDLYAFKKLTYLKNLELYQYTLDSDFDLQFSDGPGLFYLETIDTATNLTSVLVYKMGNFLTNSLYDVINLPGNYRHNNLLIQVCGFNVDYVNLVSNVEFIVYRQFESPILVIEDTFQDFQLDVSYYNTWQNQNLTTLNFSIVNYPSQFFATQIFNTTIKGNLKLNTHGQHTWDPRRWFDGHVVGYDYTSDDPNVKLIDQIYEKGEIDVRATDFVDSFTGGYAIAEDLLKFYYNGSVHKIILLPDQDQGQICLRLATRIDDLFTVTGCEHYTGGVNIYFTAEVDRKGFSWGPYLTQAHYMKNLQMVHYLLVVTDTDEPGIFGQRGGTIFLYALNLDPVTEHQMDLIDQIDSNDFFQAHGWDKEDAYLGNSHLVYDDQDDAYRLYVTEMNSGLFVLQFNHTFGHSDIQIVATNFIDLHSTLQEHDFHMPYDAHFLAVTFVSGIYNPYLEVENILVTTDKYHHFEFTIIYDQKAQVQSVHISKVYYRYGFYEAKNIVKAEQGYVIVTYVLPDWIADIDVKNSYARQYIVAYDSKEYEFDSKKGYGERYMLGGFKINNTQLAGFGFNVTYDPIHNGTRTGLVTIDVRHSQMHENSLSRNITVTANQGYHSGKMKVYPFNDFHRDEFEISYLTQHNNKLQTWEIILIAVSSFIFVLLMGYLIFLCVKNRKSKPVQEARVSLLQSETGSIALKHGQGQSVRGSLPETHFRQTNNFETQTDEQLAAPAFPIDQQGQQKIQVRSQSIVQPPVAIQQKKQTQPQNPLIQTSQVNAPVSQSQEKPKVEAPAQPQVLNSIQQVQQNRQQIKSPPTEEVHVPEVSDNNAPVFPNTDQSSAQ